MPLKRTAWACQFGCRNRLLSSRTGMEAHERRCFWNPATRSCATCEHFFPGSVSPFPDDPPEPWACAESVRDFDKEGLTTNCPRWAMKGQQ